MTVHLTFLSFILDRRRTPGRSVTHAAAPRRGRLLAALRRLAQPQAPPIDHLSDHLRRDIGLPPRGDRGRRY